MNGRFLLARSSQLGLAGDLAGAVDFAQRARNLPQLKNLGCQAGGWAVDQLTALGFCEAGVDEFAMRLRLLDRRLAIALHQQAHAFADGIGLA